ncbi:MAG TPA: heme-binding protein [Pseudolysinimonas sp.]|nr:heme-binding protein [Pseudolysinimonas sp.]
MTEHQPYALLRAFDGFEVRHYPDSALVQVQVDGDFDRAGNRAFRPLFDYISGGNRTATTFSMTAPVIQQEVADHRSVVSFVLPAGTDRDAIPAPRDARVATTIIPAHTAAAARFRGGWSESLFRRKGAELLRAVAAAGLATEGEVSYARFDPPWMPGPLKHNEALVTVLP